MSWKRWVWMGLGITALAAVGTGCGSSRKGLQGGRDDPMWSGGGFNSSNQIQTGQPEMGSVRHR